MSIIKSFSVGLGDMFYIKHSSDNFTIIDCCLVEENKKRIVDELISESKGKEITRFISTHPDEDHVQMLDYLDDRMRLLNFYCVSNETIKADKTTGFARYCELRDSVKSFKIYKGCKRKWMNESGPDNNGKEISSSGINILWPDTRNEDFKDALLKAKNGESPNNISAIIEYSFKDGATLLWMGDLENSFMEKIKNEISFSKVNILFAPHHGRKSGRVPKEWLDQMKPDIVVLGEASSENLDYNSYDAYNKITQNSAEDIIFECATKKVHVYTSNKNHTVDFLDDEKKTTYEYYIGTLNL